MAGNGTLSFYKCRLSGGDIMRWQGHSDPTLCKRICLNFLHSQATEHKNFWCERSRPSHLVKLSQFIFDFHSFISVTAFNVSEFNSTWSAWEGVTKGVIGLCSRTSLLFDFTDDQRRKVEEEIVGQQLKARVSLKMHSICGFKVCSHFTKFSPSPIFSPLLFSILSMVTH